MLIKIIQLHVTVESTETAQFTAVDDIEAHSVLSRYRFAQITYNTSENALFPSDSKLNNNNNNNTKFI